LRLSREQLLDSLRVLFITDGQGDGERVLRVAAAAARGGVRAVQVRERGMSAAELAATCERLRRLGLLVVVNDRIDVAAAGCADGVHLRGDSLPVATARALLPGALVGFSAHDRAQVERAAAGGADYVTLAPVLATPTHPGQPPLGVVRAAAIAAGAPLPVVWLGGLDAAKVAELAPYRPDGIAVVSAIAQAIDPERAARELVAAARNAQGRVAERG
jgi:thiamine-phosphate pyrophosphorylase